jgi:hypothetical protein
MTWLYPTVMVATRRRRRGPGSIMERFHDSSGRHNYQHSLSQRMGVI